MQGWDRETLERAWALQREADELMEIALRDRLNLRAVLRQMFQLLRIRLGADFAWVRTYDEALELRDYPWQAEELGQPAAWSAEMLESVVQIPGEIFRGTIDDRRAVAMRLEVAGTDFGVAAALWNDDRKGQHLDEIAGMFEIWCEVLDNHLGAHAEARRKQLVLSELSEALRHPILHDGVLGATEVLRRHLDLKTLALVYSPDGRPSSVDTAFVHLTEDGEIHGVAGEDAVSRYLAAHGIEVLHGEVGELRQLLGDSGSFDNVLVNGLTEATVVGRLVVAVEVEELSTHDRELFERFADYLRQRLVDFNREYQRLAYAFPPESVTRLLNESDYEKRLLPAEQDVAVLYTDIAGFTRLSEQVLKEPSLIGRLVDHWGEAVVNILWKHGGVFDKMVGDCVIGLWGPPFFELSPAEACDQALKAAIEIEELTRNLYSHDALPQLETMEGELGVATGINYCPMFVGRFGPDEDYTGFSSGMNNTARLQGVASRGEILCMNNVLDALGDDTEFKFSDWQEARVKNVAEPLRYKALNGEV